MQAPQRAIRETKPRRQSAQQRQAAPVNRCSAVPQACASGTGIWRCMRCRASSPGTLGLVYGGRVKTPSPSLALPLGLPSLAAAVVGGTPILGGRGYGGTIIGALILTVTALDVRLTEKN